MSLEHKGKEHIMHDASKKDHVDNVSYNNYSTSNDTLFLLCEKLKQERGNN